jgi:hypothetical protein
MRRQEVLVKELLPFCAGLATGLGLMSVRSMRLRWFALPFACVPIGALMSWINGELGTGLWPVFVSFDAILVWAGAVLVLVATSTRYRSA